MCPDSVSGVHFLFVLLCKSRFLIKFVRTYSIDKENGWTYMFQEKRTFGYRQSLLERKSDGTRTFFFNRQHRFRPGMGSVLKWRLSPNPQRKEKKTVKWDPKVCYLRSLDAVVGDSLIWLGHNSFFLQLAGKRIMFDPVFETSLLWKDRVSFLPIPTFLQKLITCLSVMTILIIWISKVSPVCWIIIRRWNCFAVWEPETDKELVSGNESDRGRLVSATGRWRLKITFLPAQHWSKRSVRDGGQRLWGAFMLQGNGVSLYYSGDTGYSTILGKSRICSELRTMPCWVSVHINPAGSCVPIISLLMNHWLLRRDARRNNHSDALRYIWFVWWTLAWSA